MRTSTKVDLCSAWWRCTHATLLLQRHTMEEKMTSDRTPETSGGRWWPRRQWSRCRVSPLTSTLESIIVNSVSNNSNKGRRLRMDCRQTGERNAAPKVYHHPWTNWKVKLSTLNTQWQTPSYSQLNKSKTTFKREYKLIYRSWVAL